MRKADLTKEQLDAIVALRRTHTPWTKIERHTGVSRRVAKRVYEEWERSQSPYLLHDARKAVAAEALRDHIDLVIGVADLLTSHLRIPDPSVDLETVDEYLEGAWDTNIIPTSESPSAPDSGLGHAPGRNRRRNLMLFQSLKTHTRGKVDWGLLDKKWKPDWNEIVGLLAKLRKEATKIVDNFLTQEEESKKGFLSALREDSRETNPEACLTKAVLEGLYRRIVHGEADLAEPIVKLLAQRGGRILMCYIDTQIPVLKLTDTTLAEKTEFTCNHSIENLCATQGQNLSSLADHISAAKEAAALLEVKLDPLVLRPIMLLTKCDLCPA